MSLPTGNPPFVAHTMRPSRPHTQSTNDHAMPDAPLHGHPSSHQQQSQPEHPRGEQSVGPRQEFQQLQHASGNQHPQQLEQQPMPHRPLIQPTSMPLQAHANALRPAPADRPEVPGQHQGYRQFMTWPTAPANTERLHLLDEKLQKWSEYHNVILANIHQQHAVPQYIWESTADHRRQIFAMINSLWAEEVELQNRMKTFIEDKEGRFSIERAVFEQQKDDWEQKRAKEQEDIDGQRQRLQEKEKEVAAREAQLGRPEAPRTSVFKKISRPTLFQKDLYQPNPPPSAREPSLPPSPRESSLAPPARGPSLAPPALEPSAPELEAQPRTTDTMRTTRSDRVIHESIERDNTRPPRSSTFNTLRRRRQSVSDNSAEQMSRPASSAKGPAFNREVGVRESVSQAGSPDNAQPMTFPFGRPSAEPSRFQTPAQRKTVSAGKRVRHEDDLLDSESVTTSVLFPQSPLPPAILPDVWKPEAFELFLENIGRIVDFAGWPPSYSVVRRVDNVPTKIDLSKDAVQSEWIERFVRVARERQEQSRINKANSEIAENPWAWFEKRAGEDWCLQATVQKTRANKISRVAEKEVKVAGEQCGDKTKTKSCNGCDDKFACMVLDVIPDEIFAVTGKKFRLRPRPRRDMPQQQQSTFSRVFGRRG